MLEKSDFAINTCHQERLTPVDICRLGGRSERHNSKNHRVKTEVPGSMFNQVIRNLTRHENNTNGENSQVRIEDPPFPGATNPYNMLKSSPSSLDTSTRTKKHSFKEF